MNALCISVTIKYILHQKRITASPDFLLIFNLSPNIMLLIYICCAYSLATFCYNIFKLHAFSFCQSPCSYFYWFFFTNCSLYYASENIIFFYICLILNSPIWFIHLCSQTFCQSVFCSELFWNESILWMNKNIESYGLIPMRVIYGNRVGSYDTDMTTGVQTCVLMQWTSGESQYIKLKLYNIKISAFVISYLL